MSIAAYMLYSVITASADDGDYKVAPTVSQLQIPMASKQACKDAQQVMIPSATDFSEYERTSVKKNPDATKNPGFIRHQTFCLPTGQP